MSIGERIKRRRKELGLSAETIAERAGVSPTTIYRYESGDIRNPRSSILRPIASVLGIDLYELVGWNSVELDDLDGESGVSGLTAEENVLLNNYRNLDPHGKRVVNFIVEAEGDRCKEERERREQSEPVRRGKVIPFRCSVQAASAGTGMYLGPEEFETLLVVENELTRRASFGVPVSGDSMEPLYRDGDVLVVEAADALEVGEIGVFTIDGDGYVKKRGDDALISLNPAYVPIPLTEGARCNGRVIGVLKPEWIVEK